MSFRSLELGDGILRAIADAGYTEPTPIQAAAIPLVLAGHDLIGIAQTGTGKTAAFTLPLLKRLTTPPAEGGFNSRGGIRALILAPTRELVVQIDENVRAYGRHLPVHLALVYGGVGMGAQIRALRQADIVIATPGRLLDHMRQGHARFDALRCLILDEADRMLDMGFIPDIRQIVRAVPKDRQTLLFSATLSREIEALTHEFQKSPKLVTIGRRSNPAETVTQILYEVPVHLKSSLLAHLMRDSSWNMVLVFTRTKHGADRVARQLEQTGISTATLHANRSQSQRLRALKDFKSGVVRVLVATDIASRGIDVDGISHVVNYDFPRHVEDYVHRIGRTGRAQAVGDAISFVSQEDHAQLRSVERFIGRGIVRKHAEGFDHGLQKPTIQQPRAPGSMPPRHSKHLGNRPSMSPLRPDQGTARHLNERPSGQMRAPKRVTQTGEELQPRQKPRLFPKHGSANPRPSGQPWRGNQGWNSRQRNPQTGR